MKLDAASVEAKKFDRRAPQLAFTEFSAQQLGAGRREFDLFAFERPRSVPAHQGGAARPGPARTRRVPEAILQGKARATPRRTASTSTRCRARSSATRRLRARRPSINPRRSPLRWDDLLGPGRNGVVLIEAEQPAAPKGQKTRGRTGARAGDQPRRRLADRGRATRCARSCSRSPTPLPRGRRPCAASTRTASR